MIPAICFAMLAAVGPNLTELGPKWVELGPILAEFGRLLVNFRPIPTDFDPDSGKVVLVRPDWGKKRPAV